MGLSILGFEICKGFANWQDFVPAERTIIEIFDG